MITRATWFVAGAAAGAVGATYTRRKVKAVAEQMAPVNVAKSIAGGPGPATGPGRGREGGSPAMRAKEDQWGRPDADALAVAPAAQIIVLSDVRQLEQLTRAVGREAASAPRAPCSRHYHPSGRRRRSRR